MAFATKTYSPEPIILITIVPPHDPAADIVSAGREIQQFANGIEGTVFSIVDMSAVSPSFGEIVQGLDIAARTKSEFVDPCIRGIFVGSHEMVKLAVESAAQQQYGGPKLPLYSSVEEALAYVRSELAKTT